MTNPILHIIIFLLAVNGCCFCHDSAKDGQEVPGVPTRSCFLARSSHQRHSMAQPLQVTPFDVSKPSGPIAIDPTIAPSEERVNQGHSVATAAPGAEAPVLKLFKMTRASTDSSQKKQDGIQKSIVQSFEHTLLFNKPHDMKPVSYENVELELLIVVAPPYGNAVMHEYTKALAENLESAFGGMRLTLVSVKLGMAYLHNDQCGGCTTAVPLTTNFEAVKVELNKAANAVQADYIESPITGLSDCLTDPLAHWSPTPYDMKTGNVVVRAIALLAGAAAPDENNKCDKSKERALRLLNRLGIPVLVVVPSSMLQGWSDYITKQTAAYHTVFMGVDEVVNDHSPLVLSASLQGTMNAKLLDMNQTSGISVVSQNGNRILGLSKYGDVGMYVSTEALLENCDAVAKNARGRFVVLVPSLGGFAPRNSIAKLSNIEELYDLVDGTFENSDLHFAVYSEDFCDVPCELRELDEFVESANIFKYGPKLKVQGPVFYGIKECIEYVSREPINAEYDFYTIIVLAFTDNFFTHEESKLDGEHCGFAEVNDLRKTIVTQKAYVAFSTKEEISHSYVNYLRSLLVGGSIITNFMKTPLTEYDGVLKSMVCNDPSLKLKQLSAHLANKPQ